MRFLKISILSALVAGTAMFASAKPADAQVYFGYGTGGYYSPGYYGYSYAYPGYGYSVVNPPYYPGYGYYGALSGEYPWDAYDYGSQYDGGYGFDYGGYNRGYVGDYGWNDGYGWGYRGIRWY